VRRTEQAFDIEVPLVSATKERLRPLVDSPLDRRIIGAASRAYVEHVHDLEQTTDRLLEVYARL
jgi:hypothetical protein